MAKIIAIINEKGGVGKTATATSLAHLLAKKGYNTALIDFDGQGHSSITLGVKNPNLLKMTINTIIRKIIEDEPLPAPDSYIIKSKSGVDLIPSNYQLFTLERNLCNVDFRERILSQYVNTIKGDYDYIIIDCMPQMGTPMINVMMCADSIIIPTQSELLSTQGLSELLRHYQLVKQNSNNKLKISGILITMDSANTNLSAQVKDMLQNSFAGSISIFQTCIPRSIKVAEAVGHHKTICEYIPDNPAAVAYEEFVEEFLKNELSSKRKELSAVG
ncbi:Sporulation initiation inhibitor protein Soj [bioreactor metagenome]|uniref:Sporulation initiation inhibitor protein Soj n=1 Tax=bioreactor metagenome TaxID=1076179 RepID=A0A645AN41_9ZZZZ